MTATCTFISRESFTISLPGGNRSALKPLEPKIFADSFVQLRVVRFRMVGLLQNPWSCDPEAVPSWFVVARRRCLFADAALSAACLAWYASLSSLCDACRTPSLPVQACRLPPPRSELASKNALQFRSRQKVVSLGDIAFFPFPNSTLNYNRRNNLRDLARILPSV